MMVNRSPTPPASSAAARATMIANKRRDTGPELALRSELHRRGLRFRIDYSLRLPGLTCRPDIVFTRRRVAVFVDGCFWHSCPDHGTLPAANRAWWREKLSANTVRDARNDDALRASGWRVIRIWEHDDVLLAADLIAEATATPGA